MECDGWSATIHVECGGEYAREAYPHLLEEVDRVTHFFCETCVQIKAGSYMFEASQRCSCFFHQVLSIQNALIEIK